MDPGLDHEYLPVQPALAQSPVLFDSAWGHLGTMLSMPIFHPLVEPVVSIVPISEHLLSALEDSEDDCEYAGATDAIVERL